MTNRIILITLLFLTACSSLPNEKDAEMELRNEISKKSHDNFSLISFKKTDAVERTFFGQELYVVQYKAKLEVHKNVYTYRNRIKGKRLFSDFKTYNQPPPFIPSFSHEVVRVKKGEKYNFYGEIFFTKTENGWKKIQDPLSI